MTTTGRNPELPRRFVAFLDVLGVRRALSLGKAEAADAKIVELDKVVGSVLQTHPGLSAHGSTDCFVLWAPPLNPCYEIVSAVVGIMCRYYDINVSKNTTDLDEAFLLRAGLGYGLTHVQGSDTSQVTSTFLLGSGLADAFEAQATSPGMRFLISRNALQQLNYRSSAIPAHLHSAEIHKAHDGRGEILTYEFQWPGTSKRAMKDLRTASEMFEVSLSKCRKGQIPERVVLQYQQTLCTILRSVTDQRTLLRYCSWRHRRTKYDEQYGIVWATAWLRLLTIMPPEDTSRWRTALRDKYIQIAGTRVAGLVSSELKRRNAWKSVKRVLLNV